MTDTTVDWADKITVHPHPHPRVSAVSVYLAARFSRIEEMRDRRNDLSKLGIRVTSRWLNGGHEWEGTPDDLIPPAEAARFAREDLEDIHAADVMIAFTEPPRSNASRGGRHIEAGFALAMNKPLIVVGYRENVFYCLPQVLFFPDWPAAIEMIRATYAAKWIAQR